MLGEAFVLSGLVMAYDYDSSFAFRTTTETPATGGGGGSGVSKRSAAVRVIIPPNINDPLNLDASSDNEDSHTDALQRQLRRRRRRVSITQAC